MKCIHPHALAEGEILRRPSSGDQSRAQGGASSHRRGPCTTANHLSAKEPGPSRRGRQPTSQERDHQGVVHCTSQPGVIQMPHSPPPQGPESTHAYPSMYPRAYTEAARLTRRNTRSSGLLPCSWHRTPKTLRISKVKIKLSFIIHNRPLPATPEFMLMQ